MTDDDLESTLVDRRSSGNLVHVNNLRLFQSDMCITTEPTEDGEPLTIWRFFQNLAGSRQTQKIENVRILSGSGASCKCGALKEGTQRLRDLCLCRGGWATITFSSPDGARNLTTCLDEHKRLHDSGAGPLGDHDINGFVNFCENCCLFQRQVHVSRGNPPTAADLLVQPDLGVEAMVAISQERLEAMIVILSGIIQGNYPRDIVTLKNNVDGELIVEAERGIRAGAETLIRRFCGRADTVCEYFMAYYIKATALLLPQQALELAYNVVDLLDTAQPGHSVTVREELMANIDIDARTALITKLARIATEGSVTDSPRLDVPPTANHSTANRDQRILSQDKAMGEALLELLQRLEDYLVNNPPEAYQDSSIGLARLHSVKEEVVKEFEEITVMLSDVRMPDALKRRYREYLRQLSLEKDALLRVLDKEIQKALLAERDSGRGHVDPIEPIGDAPPTDGPNGDEIDHEVSLFTAQFRTIVKMEEQCDTVLKDENLSKNRHKFISLQKTVCPSGSSMLKDLGEAVKLFSKWLRQASPDMTAERTRSLRKCVADGRSLQIRWQKLLLLIRKADGRHGFSQTSAVSAAAPSTPIEVETFWGQMEGKPFQNLVEWLAELEDRVLRHYPSHEDRVEHALAHLAPGVVAILRPHKLSTYEDLRAWLLEYFLNEQDIMDDWVRQLDVVGSSNKHMASNQVGLYVTQVRGILKQILEYSTTTVELRQRLFTTPSVAHLGKTALKPLKRPTGKDQWDEFSTTVYAKLKSDAVAAGEEVSPEVLLAKVEDWLEHIKRTQKAKADLAEEARLGAFRGTSGACEFERKLQHLVQILEEDGNDYDDVVAVAAGILCNGSADTPSDASGLDKNAARRRRRNAGKPKAFSHVQVQIQALNPGWGAGIPCYQVTKGKKQSFIPEASQILISQESLDQAVAWQGQFRLRCWVCPNDNPGHEFASCEIALAGPNSVRLEALSDPKQGPGYQCFSCLEGTCFVKRCLERAKSGKRGRLSLCTKSTKNTECALCAQEIENDVKKKGKIKPFHTIVCCCEGHAGLMNPQDIISKLKPLYGEGTQRLHVGLVQLGITQPIPDSDFSSFRASQRTQTDKKVSFDPAIPKSSERGKRPRLKREVDERNLPPHFVDTDTYPDTHVSKVIDTSSGTVTNFDPETSGVQVIGEPGGMAVYFMQFLALGGVTILCFYDTGAQMSLIETSLARELKLRMIDRNGFLMIGAGNHVTRTTDGTYELLLGRNQGENIYRFGVCGMQKLTGRMAPCDWKPAHTAIKQEGKRLAQEYDSVKHLDRFLQPGEILPPSSGGNRARLLIGLKLPDLQPTVMFHLPSGILVARTKLYDTFNSNVVFGGVYQLVDHFTQQAYAKYASAYACDPYTAFNRHCFTEYIMFRDSVYPDMITMTGQDEDEQWDMETGEGVGAPAHGDNLLTAATGSGKTDSKRCLEEVYSLQESEEDKDKSKMLRSQLMEPSRNDPNEDGSQDCQITRYTDKPQDIANLHEGVSVSRLYETPKTVVVEPTGHLMSYGQPKTTPVLGYDAWSMLNTRNGGATGQSDKLTDNVDPITALIKSSEPTATPLDVGKLSFCVQANVRQTVINPVDLSEISSLDTHWCTKLAHGGNRMPPKPSASGWLTCGAINSGIPDWAGIRDLNSCPTGLFSVEVCNVSGRTCVGYIAAGHSPVKPTTAINQANTHPTEGELGLGTVVKFTNVSRLVDNPCPGRHLPRGRHMQPWTGDSGLWLRSIEISTRCTPEGGEIQEIVEQPPCLSNVYPNASSPLAVGNPLARDFKRASRCWTRSWHVLFPPLPRGTDQLEDGRFQLGVSPPAQHNGRALCWEAVVPDSTMTLLWSTVSSGTGLIPVATAPGKPVIRLHCLERLAGTSNARGNARGCSTECERARILGIEPGSRDIDCAMDCDAVMRSSDCVCSGLHNGDIDICVWLCYLGGPLGKHSKELSSMDCERMPGISNFLVVRPRYIQGKSDPDQVENAGQVAYNPQKLRLKVSRMPIMAVSEPFFWGGLSHLAGISLIEIETYPCRYQSKKLAIFISRTRTQSAKSVLVQPPVKGQYSQTLLENLSSEIENMFEQRNYSDRVNIGHVKPANIMLRTLLSINMQLKSLCSLQPTVVRSAHKLTDINQVTDGCTVPAGEYSRYKRHSMLGKTMVHRPIRPILRRGLLSSFRAIQIDEFGPFFGHTMDNFDELPMMFSILTITCVTTHTVNIWMVETREVSTVVRAIYQHFYIYGYPVITYVAWSGVVKRTHHKINSITTHSQLMAVYRISPVWEAIRQWVVNHNLLLTEESRDDLRIGRDVIASLYRYSPQDVHVDRIITSAKLRAEFNGQDPDLVVGMTRCDWLDHISEIPYPQPIRSGYCMETNEPKLGDLVLFMHYVKYVSVEQFADVSKCQGIWRTGRICRVDVNPLSAVPMYYISYLRTTGRGYRQPADWAISRSTVCRFLREIYPIASVDEIKSLTTQW